MTGKKRRIKVLYVQVYPGGGSFVALHEMLLKLNTEEIEPVVLCYYKSKDSKAIENIKGCRVVYAEENFNLLRSCKTLVSKNKWVNAVLVQYNALIKYFYFDKALMNFICTVIAKERPDILHHNNDIETNRVSIRAGIKRNIPQILHHRSFINYRFKMVDHIIDSFLIKKIGFHIYITEAVNDYYKKEFHTLSSNYAIIHDFVDSTVYKSSYPSQLIKKEFGIADDEIIITDVGRIIHWKGQHVLIEALKIVKDTLPKFKVLIVGSAEKGIGSKRYYNHLRGLACAYQLQDKIIFTGDRTDVAEIMNTSDVIVHTAVKPEPQGMVIIEALLCKKTVIASDDAGSAELIKKYGGILFQPGNALQLAEILLKLFQNKNGDHAPIATSYPTDYRQLNSDFDSGVKAKQMVDIYRKCMHV